MLMVKVTAWPEVL